jgi:predicted enzyme involved in methoxymalonyl-ACP biosynthesis
MPDLQSSNMDYAHLVRLSRRLDPAVTVREIKIALLSDAATQQFVPLLRTLFHRSRVHASVYEGPFDGVELQAINPDSELYRFQPDVIVLLNSVQALRGRFAKRAGDASAFLEQEAAGIVRIWDALQSHSKATLIQSNFVMPYERYFGNFDQKVPASFSSVVSSLNAHIAQQARSRAGVLVNDVATGSAPWCAPRTHSA